MIHIEPIRFIRDNMVLTAVTLIALVILSDLLKKYITQNKDKEKGRK
ncbi:hypothetical protein [Enterococcus rivorum]|nr:hypothetical protein [Enterococcus rivorum]MBP2099885.1 hypothetical protein [Enterococcus rivorum]